MKAGNWQTWTRHLVRNCEICGKIISVIAHGRCDVNLSCVLKKAGLPPEEYDSVLDWVGQAVVVKGQPCAVG